MPVSTWKRLLSLLNLAAVLGLAGTGYAFFQHRDYLARPFQKPSFQIDGGNKGPPIAKTDAIAITLGRPFEPVKKAEGSGGAQAEAKETILTALQRLGTIIDAVALEPPYTDVHPTITFQFTADQKTKVLKLGEALVTKKKGPLNVPHQYQFIGCKLDRADPDVVYFWFRMRADGDDKQWLKWRAEPELQHDYVTAGDNTLEFSPSIKGSNGVFRAADLETILAAMPDNPDADRKSVV